MPGPQNRFPLSNINRTETKCIHCTIQFCISCVFQLKSPFGDPCLHIGLTSAAETGTIVPLTKSWRIWRPAADACYPVWNRALSVTQ